MPAISRTTLNDQVYEALRRAVLRRDPGPGTKMSLHELARELKVSRSPVHHALTRLVSEGLVSVKARRGYYVTPVTAPMVREAYDVRLTLELHAAERAVGVVDALRLQSFRALMDASEHATTEESWNAANAAFHQFQIDLADNGVLSRLYREMPVNTIVQVVRGGRLADGEELAREHRAIVEGFEAGDLPAAQEAIRKHIASGERRALDVIARAGGEL